MRLQLLMGAYEARSVIANAQRCVNLYVEVNPLLPKASSTNPEGDAPVPDTHYPMPGLTRLAYATTRQNFRGAFTAKNGALYVVVYNQVYYVDLNWSFTLLGTIGTTVGPVSMDNNLTHVLLVDGSENNGYAIELATNEFIFVGAGDLLLEDGTELLLEDSIALELEPAFYGADVVRVLDGYFLLNRPGTNQFYWSGIESLSFDALDIATKNGYPDNIVGLTVVHREIWLIGEQTTEIWFNSGAADSTFERMPGVFIQHGAVSAACIASMDLLSYWVAKDPQGQGFVVRGNNYAVERISTYALEKALQGYSTIADAQTYCFQQLGHFFVVINFPTAGKTWVYDEGAKRWTEWESMQADGAPGRHRAACVVPAYGAMVAGDFENGKLYQLSPDVYTEDGLPIVRRRGFLHLLNDGRRVTYNSFIADVAVGTVESATPQSIYLRWSDTRGASWGNPVEQTMGAAGQYLTSVQWQRLGIARDRVFELFWSGPMLTAVNGAFITYSQNES